MDGRSIREYDLCKMIDHTLLKPWAAKEELEQLCKEAEEHHFAMVAIHSVQTNLCKEFLRDSDVHVGAAISFPHGQTTIKVKCYETEQAILDGADEIDYVIHQGKVKEGNFGYIQKEMEAIVSICREQKVISKVILETCNLTEDEIIRISQIASQVRPDFVKTSTGFGSAGATAEHVRVMKKYVGDMVKVKAAGGIRSWEDCLKMLDAGAERIGTSQSLKILQGFRVARGKE